MARFHMGENRRVSVVVAGVQPGRVRFQVSALAELGSVLHAADDPGHHPSSHALDQVGAGMSRPLKSQAERYTFLWRSFRGRVMLPAVGPEPSGLGEEIDRIREMPPETFTEQLVQALRGGGSVHEVRGIGSDGDLQDRVMAHARARGQDVVELLEELLKEPERVQDELSNFLASCGRSFFDELWISVRPILRRDVAERSQMLTRFGPAAALLAAVPSCRLGVADDTLVIDKVHSGRIDLDSAALVMVPTLFGRPHLVVKDEGEDPVVQYPIADPRERQTPSLSVQTLRLRALADPVRLQLCRDLAREARSTMQLADRWSLDSAVVSRHLRQLREANLVTVEREGHFVMYRLNAEELANLGNDLLEALLR